MSHYRKSGSDHSRLPPSYCLSSAAEQFPIADIPSAMLHCSMIALVMLVAVQSSGAECDLAAIKTARAVHERLGRRAVEIVSAASTTGSLADARLSQMVNQSASFSLGGGDVGRPLGTGSAGTRSLAVTMGADQYRFLGWDYMDGLADGCGKQSITVEFVSTADRLVSQVEFRFDQGRVIEAKGWQRSFESGSLPHPTAGGSGS